MRDEFIDTCELQGKKNPSGICRSMFDSSLSLEKYEALKLDFSELTDAEEPKIPVGTIREDIPCENCGAPIILRIGPYGYFYGCSTFPACRGVRKANQSTREPLSVSVRK